MKRTSFVCWGGKVVCYLCVCRCTHVYWCKGIGMCWCGDQRSTSASFFWCCHSFKTVNLFKNIMYVYNVLWSHSRGDLSLGPVPHRLTSLIGQWTSCNLLLLLPEHVPTWLSPPPKGWDFYAPVTSTLPLSNFLDSKNKIISVWQMAFLLWPWNKPHPFQYF